MARYKHASTGVVVSVRDDKVLGSEWEPVLVEVKASQAPQRSKKQDSKESN